MRLVPAYLAEVAAGDAAPQLTSYGRELGERVEVDLDAVGVDHPQLAQQILRYLALVNQFRQQPSGAYTAIQVPLLAVRQQDNRNGRVDLVPQLDALERSVIATVADTLLSGTPDLERLLTLGASHQITVKQDGANLTSCRLTVTGTRDWDRALGGATGPDEVARILTLEANHAGWRDRRARRLVALSADAVVLLPTPERLALNTR